MKKEEKGMKKMIAKDGKLFDIDNIKKPSKSHQVEIIISKTKRQTS